MQFRDEIVKQLQQAGVQDADKLLEVPPNAEMGHYALPCFSLAKERKLAPPVIAQELAKKLDAPFIASCAAVGPYVNIHIKPEAVAQDVLHAVLVHPHGFGKQVPKADRVMVEYSQPNTHKAFHIGHVRNTALGEALSRILRFAGYEVIQANYMGDTGAHIAKWLWYYQQHPTPLPTQRDKQEQWLAHNYVQAIQLLEKHPERQTEVDAILTILDQRTPGELFTLYEKTRAMSIESFQAIYEQLYAHFQYWFYESEVEERGKNISRELLERNIAIEEDGAVLMDLKSMNLGVWILLRKDGTALYSAKDLALAERKFSEFKIDRAVYVVGAAQNLHFQQLFATLRLAGFSQADKCYHLSYNEVRLPTGKMSSRSGQNILYSDMHTEIVRYASEEVKKRHEDWNDERVERSASQVTIAALKWDMLATDPNKIIVFDPKNATQFEGDTGPYVQYTHARAHSILGKAGDEESAGDGKTLEHPKEQELLLALDQFPQAVEKAAREYAPQHVAHCILSIAKAFNSFYHDCPVLGVTGAVRNDRLTLVRATAVVLATGLDLLAIDAPKEL